MGSFYVTLPSRRDHSGIIYKSLGSRCGHFGLTLGSLWDPFGVILEAFSDEFWNRFGMFLGSIQRHFGFILARKGIQHWPFSKYPQSTAETNRRHKRRATALPAWGVTTLVQILQNSRLENHSVPVLGT